MILNKRYFPELLVDTSLSLGLRAARENCYLDLSGDSPRLIATNGVALVSVPVKIEKGDTEGLIPAKAIAGARKLDRKAPEVRLRATTHDVEIPEVLMLFDRPGEKFPDWKKTRPNSTKTIIRICLDAFKLLTLAKAMGAKRNIVELSFDPAPLTYTGNNAVINIRCDDSEVEALLMRAIPFVAS